MWLLINMLRTCLIGISFLFLTACGFTLRGTDSPALPLSIQQLNLSYQSNSSELGQILNRRLRSAGVEVSETSATYVLTLRAELVRERIISVNRNVRAGEYELSLTVSFQLENNGNIVIPVEVLTFDQVYEADPNNAAAKTSEAELVLNEIRQAIAEQILRRLQTIS